MARRTRLHCSAVAATFGIAVVLAACGTAADDTTTGSVPGDAPTSAAAEPSTDALTQTPEDEPPYGAVLSTGTVSMSDSDGFTFEWEVTNYEVQDYTPGSVADDVCPVAGRDVSRYADDYSALKFQVVTFSVSNTSPGGLVPRVLPYIDFANPNMEFCTPSGEMTTGVEAFDTEHQMVVMWPGQKTPEYPGGEFTTTLWRDYELELSSPERGEECSFNTGNLSPSGASPCGFNPGAGSS